MSLLYSLEKPADLKKLNIDALKKLCGEIRQEIISAVQDNGGHLASNLGIVETTVAVHYVFDLPTDKLVFDVGHQCYTHKILSGRREELHTMRSSGSISGFPDKSESEYDPFTTGHAGASIASSLGLCEARDKKGEEYNVINIVGDGSIVNGLNLEAIYSANAKPQKLLVILNDNEMSISQNVNGFYKSISKGTLKSSYIRRKYKIKRILGDSVFATFLRKSRSFVKRIFNRNNYFEQFGFKYVGILDGNNLQEMIEVLERVKGAIEHKAVLLHIKTTKGNGFEKAEKQADLYHGVGKNMDICEGYYSSQAGKTVCDLIDKDKKVVVVTSAMKDGTGMSKLALKYPNNFHDVGIAEEYAVTYAAGMARGGLKPIVAIYSTFLQRAYDQILHDVCLQELPVVFLLDRAGLVGSDGKTHQGLFDLSFLTHLPNMKIFAPTNASELDGIIRYALTLNCPVAIRYPNDRKGNEREAQSIDVAPWEEISVGKHGNFLAVGPRMLEIALGVRDRLKEKRIDVGVINARTVKPIPYDTLGKYAKAPIITLEENQVYGGFGSLVKQVLGEIGKEAKVLSLGVCDRFVEHGSVGFQLESCGLDELSVLTATLNFIK